MRNLVRKLLMLCSVLFCLPSASMAQGYPVIDVTNWLAAIDQLYSSYDMVMNTIKQVEQAYQQYQFYLEQAKSWDLDNIQWDGDLDFRDKIKDVTRSVNKQLTNIRKIEEIFTTKQYSVGGMTFTVADLVGAGNDEKDLASVLKGVGKEFKNSEHGTCFHLSVASSFSSIGACSFLSTGPFASSGRFITRYFILDVMVNGIVSLILFLIFCCL